MSGSRKTRLSLFAAAVETTCRRRRLLHRGDRILVALSGGPDSTALIAALAELRDAGRLAHLAALHVDHGLRPGSAQDADFCEELCRRLGIPLERVKVVVASGNIQAQARRARYAALEGAALRFGATRIATGHTRTDQAETVLLRLLRGSGARGLSGIPPRRGPFIRPLIDRSRVEVLAYLNGGGLSWREDPSNATLRFLRNRVRRQLMPMLETVNPSVESALARAADLLRDDDRALDRRGRRLVQDPGGVGLQRLRSEPVAVRRRVVRDLWRQAHGRSAGLSATHVEAVLRLCRRAGPGVAALPGGLEARCRYGRLTVGPAPGTPPPEGPALILPGPGSYPVPGRAWRLEVQIRAGAAAEEIAWPLSLRARRPGDRFRPEGGRGSKKLGRWLIDRKVPREERGQMLVLADDRGQVLLLPDLGLRSASGALDLTWERGPDG